MNERTPTRTQKNIYIDQAGVSVTVYIHRWRDGEYISSHRYDASPFDYHPAHHNPTFIARRIRRAVRLLDASLKQQWGQQ